MTDDPRVPDGAQNPPTTERPAGGPDPDNQPPPPPPESDPTQEYDGVVEGERPSSNDNEQPFEERV